jgi:hypothetical protein
MANVKGEREEKYQMANNKWQIGGQLSAISGQPSAVI